MEKQDVDPLSFFDLAIRKKYLVERASKEDIHRGIDFYVKGKYKHLNKEVKMLFAVKRKKSKKKNRYLDRWTWVEYKNTSQKPGWIYGPAHFIAFERSNDYIIINRKVLLEYLNGKKSKVRWDMPFVAEPKEAKYRIYQNPRNGAQICQILSKDILSLEGASVWKKDGDPIKS